jgi:cysteine desulfurase
LELIFTSGASESNNTILKSCFQLRPSRTEFITTRMEHPSVLETFKALEILGAKVHYIEVNRKGQFNWEQFRRALSEKTNLVSVMSANNETGLILPLDQIVHESHAVGALVHTDAVQAFGKIPFDFKNLKVDYASLSGHKFYALKGVGISFVRRGSPYVPLIHGGAQERYRRAGTENVLAIHSLGIMSQHLSQVGAQYERLENLRNQFEKKLQERLQGVSITHAEAPRLPNTSSLVIEGIDGETLLMSLDLKGFSVSTGAACSSGSPEPSPVLLSIGLTRAEAQSSLRVSMGWHTSSEEMDLFLDTLIQVVHRLRSLQIKEEYHVSAN